MDTPICDFVHNYAKAAPLRLHMPGHKGCGMLGFEKYDITEIDGADSLYEASGIIRESERNAGLLFGADTFYSTEGSSLSIRAMLHLAIVHAKECGKRPVIAAARNAHKAFMNAAALLDFDVMWIYPSKTDSYLSCRIEADKLDALLSFAKDMPTAVYVTSPDYLGNITDIASLSAVCKKHGLLLLVDNAHGAYLKFLPKSLHPIDLGADMCCDSAHKTLPTLTGGAYLHISHSAPSFFKENAKNALALFGSTSPSYLILESLDMTNRYIQDGYAKKLADFVTMTNELKSHLTSIGFRLLGDEPLKMTIDTKAYGYIGTDFAARLAGKNIICEFADPDFVVLMLTPETGKEGIEAIRRAMESIEQKSPPCAPPPSVTKAQRMMSIRDAVLAPSEELDISECCGRVLAHANVSCPPAVPIVACGERIDMAAIECMKYYGIKKCRVVK